MCFYFMLYMQLLSQPFVVQMGVGKVKKKCKRKYLKCIVWVKDQDEIVHDPAKSSWFRLQLTPFNQILLQLGCHLFHYQGLELIFLLLEVKCILP